MNKETQLRKLIREELMREGFLSNIKDAAKYALDKFKEKAGHRKVKCKIRFIYKDGGKVEIRVESFWSSSFEDYYNGVIWRFLNALDNKFQLNSKYNVDLEDIFFKGNYNYKRNNEIPLEDANKISNFLINFKGDSSTNIFTKKRSTYREDDFRGNRTETETDLFVGDISLADVNSDDMTNY